MVTKQFSDSVWVAHIVFWLRSGFRILVEKPISYSGYEQIFVFWLWNDFRISAAKFTFCSGRNKHLNSSFENFLNFKLKRTLWTICLFSKLINKVEILRSSSEQYGDGDLHMPYNGMQPKAVGAIKVVRLVQDSKRWWKKKKLKKLLSPNGIWVLLWLRCFDDFCSFVYVVNRSMLFRFWLLIYVVSWRRREASNSVQ